MGNCIGKSKQEPTQDKVIIVYFWKPLDGSYGHASMTLSDGTHISFWPSETISYQGKGTKKGGTTSVLGYMAGALQWVDPIPDMTLLKDKVFEERRCDQQILLPKDCLDEDRIAIWWEKFRVSNKYNFLRLNCATVVWKAMIEGGILKYVNDPGYWWWDPESVRVAALAIEESKKRKTKIDLKLDPITDEMNANAKQADLNGKIVDTALSMGKRKKFG